MLIHDTCKYKKKWQAYYIDDITGATYFGEI